MSRDMTKPSKWVSAQHPPSLISLRCALNGQLTTQAFFMWTAKTDQTQRMPRLIWVFAGCTVTLLVLSCRGSYFLHMSVFFLGLKKQLNAGSWQFTVSLTKIFLQLPTLHTLFKSSSLKFTGGIFKTDTFTSWFFIKLIVHVSDVLSGVLSFPSSFCGLRFVYLSNHPQLPYPPFSHLGVNSDMCNIMAVYAKCELCLSYRNIVIHIQLGQKYLTDCFYLWYCNKGIYFKRNLKLISLCVLKNKYLKRFDDFVFHFFSRGI